jgi:zinc and cadmium transporter
MSPFLWILSSGLVMSAIALVGSLALVIPTEALRRLLRPLVAFAAGTLLGSAFLHMIPGAIEHAGAHTMVFLFVLAGFATFFALEQFLEWRHCDDNYVEGAPRPLTWLILLGDGLHNFLDGLAVAGAFLVDIRLGMGAWLATAAHEVPQELGDFAVLVHGGLTRRKALLYNLLSALLFVVGGMMAWLAAARIDVALLLPFAAGNFLYIAASDLVPAVRTSRSWRDNLLHFGALIAGMLLMLGLRIALD